MQNEWQKASESLSNIIVLSNPNNQPVTIKGDSEGARCIGVGTDAAVFQSYCAPEYAFKIYAEDRLDKIKAEERVYQQLEGSSFFSTCFASTDRFLVLSYEEGITLFDCLLQGVHIPERVIHDVEDAREYVRQKELNPRDIHLKNILMQNGRAKILDVSEYIQPGNDYRWEHLKEAYGRYYHLMDGRPIPFWLLETIRKWYHQRQKNFPSFEDFMHFVLKHITFKNK
ncbi:serine/threonine protein kinase [Oceanobacillus massiliensis]|uniref:serine/threonine protein kinase n=1 Tax=Oceanobacillus massiliensis TaxID=1465765 RepID=UPI003019010E